MEGELRGDRVVVGGDARQRFHDARGYGRPLDGDEVALAPVEAAHLLFRGDLDAVLTAEGSVGLSGLLDRFGLVRDFVVYRDLRDRGFYLSPAREEWVPDGVDPNGCQFAVYPRGKDRTDGVVAYRLRVTDERVPVDLASLVADGGGAVAVVDEEGEPTYFEAGVGTAGGGNDADGAPPVDLPDAGPATLLDDRAVAWDPPAELYERHFYGQRLAGRNADGGPLQLSLVEALHLADAGALDLDPDTVRERGRAVEPRRFDRRCRVYAALRDAGAVPKSGFKFGADFRVYDDFHSVDEMGHSDRLVRIATLDYAPQPRDLSLDVRLAGGVRKRMVFALTGPESVEWLAVERLTP